MKKVFSTLTLLLLISVLSFAQTELQNKAHAVALEYQGVTSCSNIELLSVQNQLVVYLQQAESGSISPSAQADYNSILNTITGSQALNSSNVFTGSVEAGNTTSRGPWENNIVHGACVTDAAVNVSGRYYDVVQVTSSGGTVNFEVNSSTIGDMYFILYCSFDPNNPTENVFARDDDSGPGLLPALNGLSLPAGTYDLVVTTFSAGDTGDYEITYSGDIAFATVPVGYFWIGGLFLLLASVVVVKRFFF